MFWYCHEFGAWVGGVAQVFYSDFMWFNGGLCTMIFRRKPLDFCIFLLWAVVWIYSSETRRLIDAAYLFNLSCCCIISISYACSFFQSLYVFAACGGAGARQIKSDGWVLAGDSIFDFVCFLVCLFVCAVHWITFFIEAIFTYECF